MQYYIHKIIENNEIGNSSHWILASFEIVLSFTKLEAGDKPVGNHLPCLKQIPVPFSTTFGSPNTTIVILEQSQE